MDRALAGDAGAPAGYTAAMAELGLDFAWAKRLAAVFYRFPQVAYRHGVMRPGAPEQMARLFSGELRYRDLAGRALKRLASAVMGRR